MILLDTSGVFAYLDPKDAKHEAARSVLSSSRPPRLLSPFVLAEIDYLVQRRIGIRAELMLLEDVIAGAYQLVPFDVADLDKARDVVARYADLGIGLADASIVVLAERFDTRDVLTLDAHFRALRVGRRPFTVLPA